jgi:selenophosphate synthetase-related protein
MPSNAKDIARNLFYYAKGNPQRIAAIQSAFDAAMTGALTKGGMDMITAASKNNVSMSKLAGMNETDRQNALRWALQYLMAGFVPSQSRSIGRFF